jgi:hypothetical protein
VCGKFGGLLPIIKPKKMKSLNIHLQMSLPDHAGPIEPQIVVESTPPVATNAVTRKYEWKSNIAETVELIYAYYHAKCIYVDGQPADIMGVAAYFEDTLGLRLGNVYDVHLHNKRRKKDKAPFLRKLLNGFLEAL